MLTWANGSAVASSGSAAITVIPRCSPLDLVRLWCGVVASPQVITGHASFAEADLHRAVVVHVPDHLTGGGGAK